MEQEAGIMADLGNADTPEGKGRVSNSMRLETLSTELSTSGHTDIVDITTRVQQNLEKTKLREGTCTVFAIGSTGGLTTVEYEPGLVKDLKAFFEKIAPETGQYFHEETWHDGNGYAHVRSSLLKTSLSIPFIEGRLMLGTWQQVIFLDFDNRERQRTIVQQFIGI